MIKIKTLPCPHCGDIEFINVTEEEYQSYKNGELIQRAFPNVKPEDRERLITGICPKCWKKIFRKIKND